MDKPKISEENSLIAGFIGNSGPASRVEADVVDFFTQRHDPSIIEREIVAYTDMQYALEKQVGKPVLIDMPSEKGFLAGILTDANLKLKDKYVTIKIKECRIYDKVNNPSSRGDIPSLYVFKKASRSDPIFHLDNLIEEDRLDNWKSFVYYGKNLEKYLGGKFYTSPSKVPYGPELYSDGFLYKNLLVSLGLGENELIESINEPGWFKDNEVTKDLTRTAELRNLTTPQSLFLSLANDLVKYHQDIISWGEPSLFTPRMEKEKYWNFVNGQIFSMNGAKKNLVNVLNLMPKGSSFNRSYLEKIEDRVKDVPKVPKRHDFRLHSK